MDIKFAIDKLSANKKVFEALLKGVTEDQINWRPLENKWTVLEIACHLADEEREDFRQRIEYTLLKAGQAWPPIDPEGWVKSREYQKRSFNVTIEEFTREREKSIHWLRGLDSVNWDNEYLHPQIGAMSAKLLLFNWLAHDYFHIRQINRYNFEFLDQQTKEQLKYAGKW